MTKNTHIPYTYLIGWSWIDKWYYGVRYARNCHPDDLWTSYFTSSINVMEYRWLYGEPDIIEIRKIFNNSLQAREWEHKVLRRIDVIGDDKWLNKTTNKAFPIYIRIYSKTDKQILSKSLLGRKLSFNHRQNISIALKGRVFRTTEEYLEAGKKISKTNKRQNFFRRTP